MEKQLRQFNKYLDNHYVKGWDNLCRKYGTLCSYKKGETFIALGQTARYIGLIKSGSVKYVVYTSDGKERVINLETVGGYSSACSQDVLTILMDMVNCSCNSART